MEKLRKWVFRYSEDLSVVRVGVVNMLIFQQLCCTKKKKYLNFIFSLICGSYAAVPMQANPYQNQSRSLLMFFYDQNAYLYYFIKLTEYVKAHNFNCNKTWTTEPQWN